LGKLLAAYRSAVRARMLIPVGLAAAMLAYNTLNPEQPLTLVQEVRSRWLHSWRVSVDFLHFGLPHCMFCRVRIGIHICWHSCLGSLRRCDRP